MESRRLDRLLVHAAGVVIAHLLCLRGQSWIDMRGFGFFRNVMQRVVVVFDQFVKAAPARIFRRHLRPFDPSAVGEHEEIILWFYGQVPVARVQWRRIFFDRRLRLSAQTGGTQKRNDDCDK